jgi:beta-glucanase (GH16 family)
MTKHPAAVAAVTLALGLAACLVRAGPTAAAAPLAKSPDGRPLTLTFSDDFNSFRRWSNGKGVWRTTFRDGKSDDQYGLRTLKWNKELELYVDPDMRAYGQEKAPALGLNPFRTQDGVLEISARPAPPELDGRLGGFRYISGLISSQPTFSQTYGYFEMRAKLPRGKGVWPAFWMLPADLDWPPEIDIMESVGDPSAVYVTAHSKVDKTPGQKVTVSPDAFHTYAVSWDPRQLIWFVDGKEVKRQPTPADMNKPMYMLANIALGGDWAGTPDASTPFPARMSIDYIRAYRFAR